VTQAVAIEICEKLVTALNSYFSSQFTAVRAYCPAYKLEDMGTLHVTVVPADLETTPADRSRDQEMHAVHVAVQQRFAAEDGVIPLDDLDGLMLLCEQIRDYLRTLRLPGLMIDARRVKTEAKPIYDPKQLRELHQFTGILVFTYRVVR